MAYVLQGLHDCFVEKGPRAIRIEEMVAREAIAKLWAGDSARLSDITR